MLHTRILMLAVAWVVFCSSIQAQPQGPEQVVNAAGRGEKSIVETAIRSGVSPNCKDGKGRTPLHAAAANAHQATAELLMSLGADINAVDSAGNTPLDAALSAGHDGMAAFLRSRGGVAKKQAIPTQSAGPSTATIGTLKPSLKFRNAEEFAKVIGEPACFVDSANVCVFAPKRREREVRLVFPYVVKAYDELYRIVGRHTNYKVATCIYPKGKTEGWGGTSDCCIEYSESVLDLDTQSEWVQYRIPHISGLIEEMAHSFVGATRAQFGWEMIGWSIGIQVAQKVANNPPLIADVRGTRETQRQTFEQYVRGGFVVPRNLPANVCDRIHAWILYQSAIRYGPGFWPDFFREVRAQEQALADAGKLGDADKVRNARYQITVECFDRLPGLGFKEMLKRNGVSVVTDVKSLHPEATGWNRRLSE